MLIFDIPRMLLFASFVFVLLLHLLSVNYYGPQIHLMQWSKECQAKDLTYYHRVNIPKDIATNNATDLRISPDLKSNNCMQHIMLPNGGVSVYSQILSDETLLYYYAQNNRIASNS